MKASSMGLLMMTLSQSLPASHLSCMSYLSSATGLWAPSNNPPMLCLMASNFHILTERVHLLCRLWDLNISGMGNNFIGVTLCDALEAWVKAKLPDAGNASRSSPHPCWCNDAARHCSMAG